jgi:hypothetical protein
MVSGGESYAFVGEPGLAVVPVHAAMRAHDWALRSIATCSGCKLAAACPSS